MRLAIRTDGSSIIGTGHVMRCLTLADALQEEGVECKFVCRKLEGNQIDYIRSFGYEVHALPELRLSASFGSDLAHAHWLGVDWQTDAKQTRRALGNKKLDWLVVDHYALDYQWESTLRPLYKRIMVIDDLADRQHHCDLLLDQNYGSSAERYSGLVPANCWHCHGPEYALLNPVYGELHQELVVSDKRVHRVLIYFGGGADQTNLTGMALQAFQLPELLNIQLDIVISMNYAHQKSLEEAVAHRSNVTIHHQLSDLSDLITKADLAIGAGGATTWERCCLGLPSLVVSIAENQRPASIALSNEKIIDYLGHVGEVTLETIRGKVLEYRRKSDSLLYLSEKGVNLVDGKGVKKILQALALHRLD